MPDVRNCHRKAQLEASAVENTPSTRRLQFGLRAIFIGMFILALGVGNWRLLVEWSYDYFYPIAALLVVSSWWLAQRLQNRTHYDSQRIRFSMLRVGLLIAVITCASSLWVRHRWVASFYDDAWPRSWPYPDEIILVFHDWLDSKYPAGPGYLKLHGEFHTVWLYLNLTALALCSLVGALLGFVARPTGPIGIEYWRDRIVKMYRLH